MKEAANLFLQEYYREKKLSCVSERIS